MNRFDKIQSKNIDEFVDWLDKIAAFDSAPWMYWFDNNYCYMGKDEIIHDADRDREVECAWCEITGKCRYFENMNEVPSAKEILKMWLESEDTDGI